MGATFFAVQLEDKPGELGRLATLLSDAKINIEAYAADRSGVRILTDNPDEATRILKEHRLTFSSEEVIAIELPHRPGELARIATALGKAGVNIPTTFGGGLGGTDQGRVYISVEDVDAAWDALDGYQ